MRHLTRDLRHGARMLAKNPGFTATALCTLIIGIGASTAIFSVVNAVLLRPLPYPDPQQLVGVWTVSARGNRASLDEATFLAYRDRNRSFEHMATFNAGGFTFTDVPNPERIRGGRVSADFFEVLHVRPLLGRTFRPGEDVEGRNTQVVLGYGLWQRRFGSDPAIVGQTISMNSQPYTVIGVLPPDFEFSIPGLFRPPDLWTTTTFKPDDLQRGNYLRAIARIKPGLTLAQAQTDLDAIDRAREREHPDTQAGIGSRLLSLHDEIVGDVRRVLWILFGAVAFVLLIACANVANLQLAHASVRQKELIIRVALGASRMRIVRQLLTESLLLALIGGALGTLLASWGISLLISLAPSGLPRWRAFDIDRVVLAYALGASLLTGVLFGLAPALNASSPRLSESLKDGGRTSADTAGGTRFRGGLMIAEVALSVVLLTGAGLLIRSFVELLDVNPGFETAHALMLPIDLPAYAYPDATRQAAFYDRAIDATRHISGVEVVGAIDDLPLTGDRDGGAITIAGRPPQPLNRLPVTQVRSVLADYFRAMAIPIVSGRAFTDRDLRDAPPVALINQTTARRLFPNENPVGQRFTFGAATPKSRWVTIVGIVGDVRDLALEEAAELEVYQPYSQATIPYMTLVVRTTGAPAPMIATIRDVIHRLDPSLPRFDAQTMDAVVAFNLAQRRFNMLLLGLLASIALMLAGVGIYGVIAYGVVRRRREIGVRMALGAQRRDVLGMVMGRSLTMTAIGIGVGVGAALLLTRFLASLLYSVRPSDPLTFATVTAVLAGVALLASYLPARRAMNVDPTVALRQE